MVLTVSSWRLGGCGGGEVWGFCWPDWDDDEFLRAATLAGLEAGVRLSVCRLSLTPFPKSLHSPVKVNFSQFHREPIKNRVDFPSQILHELIFSSPEDLLGRYGSAPSRCTVSAFPVRGCMSRMMMRCAWRSFDDRVARTWGTVVAPVLAGVMPVRFEILRFVTSCPQEVGTAPKKAWSTPAAASPLQFLKLGAVIFRAASHTDQTLRPCHAWRYRRERKTFFTL